jgi:two-component system, NtrC family, nitrogen regulation sensor histidine kinase GlnL
MSPTHNLADEPIGIDPLTTAILVIAADDRICQINPACENLLGISARHARQRGLAQLTTGNALERIVQQVRATQLCVTEHTLAFTVGRQRHEVSLTVSPIETHPGRVLIEFHPQAGGSRIAHEEHTLNQAQASQMLLRQLAHEIRNPLGGIRGAAQLLEAELFDATDLTEYTDVIIKETARLQALLDRMLAPARRPDIRPLNIHEVLERVRSLLLAEYPKISVRRDYDTSLPEIQGDQEQLIQALLNIARNGAQAIDGNGQIRLATRIARQVTLAMKRWPLALRIDVCDNGPGIPEAMRDTLFFPLVSGRNGGSGLGLTLAQTYIQRHRGAIHVDSVPGNTCFSIYLPIIPAHEAQP